MTPSRSKAASVAASVSASVAGICERTPVEEQVRTAGKRFKGEINGFSKLHVHPTSHVLSVDDTRSRVACPQSPDSSRKMPTQESSPSGSCVRPSPPFTRAPLGQVKHPAPEKHDENLAGCGACGKSSGDSTSPSDHGTSPATADTTCAAASPGDAKNDENTKSCGAGDSINPAYGAAQEDGEVEGEATLGEPECQPIEGIALRDSVKEDEHDGDDTSTPTASSGSEPSLVAASAEMEPGNMGDAVRFGSPALVGARADIEEGGLDGRTLEPYALSNVCTPEMAISLEEGRGSRSPGDTGGAQAPAQSPKRTESTPAFDLLDPRVVLPCAPSDDEKVRSYCTHTKREPVGFSCLPLSILCSLQYCAA